MRPLSKQQKDSLEQATAAFEKALAPGTAGWDYWTVTRGIDPLTVQAMRLGAVADSSDTPPGFEKFAGRVAIPNRCASGHVVGIKFRSIDGTEPKYHQPAGQEQRLFNLDALNRATTVLAMTEGEVDAITLESLGIPAVAVPGASNWRPHHWRLLEGIPRVVFFHDPDEAGEKLLGKVMRDLPVIPVTAPQGVKDCNEALVAGLGAELRRIALGKDAS